MSRTFNMVGGGGGKAVLAVTVTNGTATSVTATKSGVSVSLTYSGGTWLAELPSFGTWTVSATDGTRSQTDTVNASVAGLYTLTLRLQDVPNAYTQLEWISSNGAEIDTGYSAVSTCRVFGKQQSVRSSSSGGYWDSWFEEVEGSVGTSTAKAFYLQFDGAVLYFFNSVGFYFTQKNGVPISTIYEYSTSGRSITLNGSVYSISVGSGFSSINKTMEVGFMAKTWYFKITAPNATTLVRDMIPARRNSDSVVGMYDKVNGVFYSSANEYVFTAGPAV